MAEDFKVNGNNYRSAEISNGVDSEEALKEKITLSCVAQIQNLLNATSEDSLVEFSEDGFSSTNQTYSEYLLKMQELSSKEDEKEELMKEKEKLKKESEKLHDELADAKDEDEKSSITKKIDDLDIEIKSIENSIKDCDNKINIINIEIISILSNMGSNESETSGVAASSGATLTTSTETIDASLANALDQKLGAGFAAKVEEVSKNLNCNPNDLLAMMYSESGINPNIRGYNGATGLIQFMPSVLSAYGYTTDQVANMSGVEQLDLVEELLLQSKAMSGYSASDRIDAGTLYAMCFLPAVAKNDILCTNSGNLSWAYSANSPLDRDGDGAISKSDLAARLSAKYNEMRQAFG